MITLTVVLGWASPVLAQGNVHTPANADVGAGPLVAFADADVLARDAIGSGGPRLARPIAESAENIHLRRAEQRARRPAVLVGLYSTVAGLNVLDVYSTLRAIDNGAREANPLVAPAAGSVGASLAIKALTTTTSIYFAEKLWKKNRAAAIVTMVAVNAGTAAIVARNLRNARR